MDSCSQLRASRVLSLTTLPSIRRRSLVVVDGECLAEGAERVGVCEFDLERVIFKCIPWKESTEVLYSLCPTALRAAPHLYERWSQQYGWRFVKSYAGPSGSDRALADVMLAHPDLGRTRSVIILGGDHELVGPTARAISMGVSVTVVGLVGATSRQFGRVGAQVVTIPSLRMGGF